MCIWIISGYVPEYRFRLIFLIYIGLLSSLLELRIILYLLYFLIIFTFHKKTYLDNF